MSLVVRFQQCIARPREGGRSHLLTDHLREVASRSGDPSGAPVEQLLFLAGLLHDAGKAQASWQRYIANPARHRGTVPHAFMGAALFFMFGLRLRRAYVRRFPKEAGLIDGVILQLTADIADHHGEMKDLAEASPPWEAGWRNGCLEETDLTGLLEFVRANFPLAEQEVDLQPEEIPSIFKRLHAEWRRMVIAYQARRPDPNDAIAGEIVASRGRTASLIRADRFAVAGVTPRVLSANEADAALKRLAEFCRQRGESHAVRHRSSLSELRQRAQDAVVMAFGKAAPARFYTLRMPTGMGKTMAALRTALEACRQGRAERIIYVAPYLTILSQAAREIRDATGIEVMEHHHLSILDLYAKNEADPHELLLQESWQAPVVATTFNQLFRALAPKFAQETIRITAMERAFVILDEPQVVDGEVWRLFLALLEGAADCFEMTALLVTATLPPLDGLRYEPADLTPRSLPVPCRYQVAVRGRSMNEDRLADELVESVERFGAVAAILNTIEDAGRVYECVRQRCGPEVLVYSLHGAMTSVHKRWQVDRIQASLNENLPAIVVATQIIEAGVDLSFCRLYRARSTFPSLVQTAGRANRHAAQGMSAAEVVDFHFLRDGKDTRRFVYDRIAARVSDELLDRADRILEPEMGAMCEQYFAELFRRKPGTSALAYMREAALGRWSDLQHITPFQEKSFRISVFVPTEGPWIDDETRDFLVRFGVDTPEQLYELYSKRGWIGELSFAERKLFFGLMQRFVVPVAIQRARAITNLAELAEWQEVPAICLLRQPHLYRDDTGFGSLVRDLDEWIYL